MKDITTEKFSRKDILKIISGALKEFMENDAELLMLTVDERAVTHQIACYLKKYFPDWHVDCEYNRKEDNKKNISNYGKTGRVRPDIIVHKRGKEENLLVIEAKTKKHDTSNDDSKLKEFTKQKGDYKYSFGFLLIFNTGKNPHSVKYNLYLDGETEEKSEFELE